MSIRENLVAYLSSYVIDGDGGHIRSDQLNNTHDDSRLVWMELSSGFGKYFCCVADHAEHTTKIHNQ